jgi:hypothetical protein
MISNFYAFKIALRTKFLVTFTAIFTLALSTTNVSAQSGLYTQKQVPQNPYLAQSPWPMSHQNPYQQGSSPFAGPESAGDLETIRHSKSGYVNITQALSTPYPDGTIIAWGSNTSHVYKTQVAPEFKVLSRYKKPQIGSISGAYTFLDRDNMFFVPVNTTIYKFGDQEFKNLRSAIDLKSSFKIPQNLITAKREHIVGINLTWDGTLVFATNKGLIGAISREFEKFSFVRLNSSKDEDVSNSIAVDEDGGVYVVSTEKMYRIQWTGNKLSQSESDGAWSSNYETGGDILIPGRLGKGSGSTPSLMGTGDEDKFVVVTDGQTLVHLVLFWRDEIPADWKPIAPGKSRRIAAEIPVTFGDVNATQSMSEQSVLVSGYGAVVVNNDFNTKIAPKRDLLANLWSYLTVFRSNRKRVAPFGMEKFQWNPETRELKTSWANPNISCPNAIPTMSVATGLVYCVGQRKSIWNIEAVDWNSGQSAFHKATKRKYSFNSFYAATQIGYNASILYGTFNGVVKLEK